jgi:hypothetical protein
VLGASSLGEAPRHIKLPLDEGQRSLGTDPTFSRQTRYLLRGYAQPYLQLPQGTDPRFRFARAQLFLDVLGLAATTRLVCLLAGCRIRLGAITSQATVFSVATKRGHGRLRAFSLYSQR